MRIIFIVKGSSSNIVSSNNIYTKDTQITTFFPTLTDQIHLQFYIITLSSIVPVNGTACSIIHLYCY